MSDSRSAHRPMASGHCSSCGRPNGPAVPYRIAHILRLFDPGGRYQGRALRTIRKQAGGYLTVVAATDTEGACPVVAFGAGATWGESWEAASEAVNKGRWRPDKFAGQNWA